MTRLIHGKLSLEPLTFDWREKLWCFLDPGAEMTLTMDGTDTNGQDLVLWYGSDMQLHTLSSYCLTTCNTTSFTALSSEMGEQTFPV